VTSTGASGPPAGDVPAPGPPADGAPASGRRVRLHGWRHPAILALAATALASGFAQFAATAALGDIADAFGAATGEGGSVVAQVGLSGTKLGVGLAVIRLASLASLPLAALADRHGRRRILLGCVAAGLAVTTLAALSPGFWWFVALFALARPLLSAANALDGVAAAEETRARDRAKAIALVTAGYAVGAGLTALVRGVGGERLGFRGLFALALVPLAATPLLARWLEEPDRYQRLRAAADPELAALRPGRLRRLRAELRPRLRLLAVLAFAIAFVTGPANTFLFVYAENALGLSRSATAAMVLAAAPVGLAGLLLGRWGADRVGRRVTAGGTQATVALAGMLTYSGSRPAVVAGYLLGILAASAYGPSFGALGAELFPTSVRATVAGWLLAAGVAGAVAGLVAFGLLADALASFGAAAALVMAPVVVASLLFVRLPETRGLELEQSAPE
jgi:MFS family permease